jgi:glucose/mannose-6-phosphate isomerase
MKKLDYLEKIKKIDNGEVISSIENLPFQIRQVLEDGKLIKIPKEYSQIKNIVVNGMGASNIGAGILKATFGDQLKTPINIVPGYEIPAYINKNTLYVISSYSGSTEEPLSVYSEIKKRGAKIIAITAQTGGKLEKLMLAENIPGYIFNPKYNKSNIPRLGLGYSVFGIATLLAKAGLFRINQKKVEEIIVNLKNWNQKLKPQTETKNNNAKIFAEKLFNKIIIFVGAEFLTGNLRVLRNQTCENSKSFAAYLTLPELNHYAMEGLAYPVSNKNNLIFFFIDSDLYHPRIKKRSELTKSVVKKNKIAALSYKLKGGSKLEQSFELLQFGSWLTFYLAVLNEVKPGPNIWVDWFKKELK